MVNIKKQIWVKTFSKLIYHSSITNTGWQSVPQHRSRNSKCSFSKSSSMCKWNKLKCCCWSKVTTPGHNCRSNNEVSDVVMCKSMDGLKNTWTDFEMYSLSNRQTMKIVPYELSYMVKSWPTWSTRTMMLISDFSCRSSHSAAFTYSALQ